MTMDEGNRDRNAQQDGFGSGGQAQQGGRQPGQQGGMDRQSDMGGQAQQGGQQSGQQGGMDGQGGQSFGQSGQDGDRNFRQGGEGFGQNPGQSQQFDQGTGQAGGGSGTDGRLIEQIREHMDVLGEDGEKIGRVDSIDGERIKLTRADSGDGQHHYIQASDVAGIENDQVHLHAGARAMPGNDGS